MARLARCYPSIFPPLANGQLSISVVALLKHHLPEENHLELLAVVTGKSVAQTRELIAARFPRPDVPSSVRKLPERRTMIQSSLALPSTPPENVSGTAPSSGVVEPRVGVTEPCFAADATTPRTSQTEPRFTSNVTSAKEVPASAALVDGARRGGAMSVAPAIDANSVTAPEKPPTDAQRAAAPPWSSRLEPLSDQRYKVQFTGSVELARKLALARDLMRHCHPGGELGPIVERALDLLIESLMQRRFGKKARPKRTSEGPRSTDPERRSDVTSDRSTIRVAAEPSTTLADAPTHDTPTRDTATSTAPESAPPESVPAESVLTDSAPPPVVTPESRSPESAGVQVDRRGELTRASVSSYIPRSTRRAVIDRDGLGCSWVDAHGVRCGSRAWLEYAHRYPRAKGGGSEPDNVRLLCRSHNRFAA